MFRVGFERDEPSIIRQRTCEPDSAIASERSDLEDRARALHTGQQHQQLALIRRHVDGWKSSGCARLECGVEVGIGRDELVDDETIDCGPEVLAHRALPRRSARQR